MPFHDLNNTDVNDLPEDMQPDPHCVWVWIVAPDTNHTSVCFDKDAAEEVADAKTGDVDVKQTRLWFDSEVAEADVHSVPGAGYGQ